MPWSDKNPLEVSDIVALHLTTLKPDDRDVVWKHTDQARIHHQDAKPITHRDIEETQKVHHKRTSWDGLPFPAQRMEVVSKLSFETSLTTATPCRWTHHHPGDGSFIPSRRISPLALLSYIDKIPMRWPQRCSNCALAPGQRCINCQCTKRAHAAAEGLRKMIINNTSKPIIIKHNIKTYTSASE